MIKNLILTPDTNIDLQLHTINSDGKWTPEDLIDHLISEDFGLVAITDHDRVETIDSIQQLGAQKGLPILTATEMTTTWRGQMTDVLCYGFDLQNTQLASLAQDIIKCQRENTQSVYTHIVQHSDIQHNADELTTILNKPSAQQPHAIVDLLKAKQYNTETTPSIGELLKDSGITFETSEIATVVNATHQSGGVCIIAHPGRSDGFPNFDVDLLNQLREDVPIDGIEVYYPLHTPEQTTMFLDYAQKHNLLISAGSDSHTPDKPPIKYPARNCRALLERLGIQLSNT